MKCPKEEKVGYVVHILKGRSYSWWQLHERTLGDGAYEHFK